VRVRLLIDLNSPSAIRRWVGRLVSLQSVYGTVRMAPTRQHAPYSPALNNRTSMPGDAAVFRRDRLC
jgi:hypothetical protein